MSTSALGSVSVSWLGTFLAAVVVGLGIGTLVPPDPVTVPAVGTVSGLPVGGGAVVAGGGLYLWLRRSTDGCAAAVPVGVDAALVATGLRAVARGRRAV